MARKLENLIDSDPVKGPSPLNILDWDEGASQSSPWFGVAITYRRETPSWQQDHESPLRRLIIDPAKPSYKP